MKNGLTTLLKAVSATKRYAAIVLCALVCFFYTREQTYGQNIARTTKTAPDTTLIPAPKSVAEYTVPTYAAPSGIDPAIPAAAVVTEQESPIAADPTSAPIAAPRSEAIIENVTVSEVEALIRGGGSGRVSRELLQMAEWRSVTFKNLWPPSAA